MTSATELEWKSLLLQVLEELVRSRGTALTGAGLNSALLLQARARGIEPPDTLRQKKFKTLLTELASDGRLVLLPNAGADVLVSSSDRSDLLTTPEVFAKRGRPAIRRDAFTAFTWAGGSGAYYDPTADTFHRADADGSPPGTIGVPSPDFVQLAERAREFARSLHPDMQPAAFAALDAPKPLSAFASFVREGNLSPAWHEFRTNAVANDMRRWAGENGLTFRSSWLTTCSEGASERAAATVSTPGDYTEHASRAQLNSFLGSLDRSEISRISVPLDIVLRLMQGQKH